MDDHPDLPEPPDRPIGHGVRVWHLAAVVLVSALLLGGLAALRKQAMGPGLGGWTVVWVVIGVFAVTCYGSAQTAKTLTRHPLNLLRRWGVRRGGADGFLAWAVSSFADVAILVGSVVAGLATAGGLVWFALSR